MSTSENKTKYDRTLGDAVYIFSALNACVFAATVLAEYNGIVKLFNPSFVEDGFCISNKDKSVYVQSHCLAFFGDTAFVIVLWLLLNYYAGDLDEAHLTPVRTNLFGIFGHGAAHYCLGVGILPKPSHATGYESIERDGKPFHMHFVIVGIYLVFYFGLCYNVKTASASTMLHLLLVCVTTFIHYFVVPRTLVFAYVSTALLVMGSISALASK